jgi:hypothetical protein
MRFLEAKLVISIAIFMPVVIITMIYSNYLFSSLGIYAQSSSRISQMQYPHLQTDYDSENQENQPRLRITSPIENQQIPIGVKFTVGGISVPSGSTANCQVSVILNHLKPYQKTIPAGTGGTEDYSYWMYTFNHSYSNIKAGKNKITAKLTCFNGNLTKWYSINVFGISNNLSWEQHQKILLSSYKISSDATSSKNENGQSNKRLPLVKNIPDIVSTHYKAIIPSNLY